VLKTCLTSGVSGRASGLALRLALEERGDCFERIAFNDQPFLLRAGFTLSPLRLWLLCHLVLSSHCTELVPEPGIGPGRLVRARGCKPRLSASSSTRGPNAKEPLNTALCELSKRNIFVANWRNLPLVVHTPIFFFALHFFRVNLQAAQDRIDRCHRRTQSRQIVFLLYQLLVHVSRRQSLSGVPKYPSHSVGNAESDWTLSSKANVRQRAEVIQHFIDMEDFVTNLHEFGFQLGATIKEPHPLAMQVSPSLRKIMFHA
jgi:hypothetical protein